ncbi:MAG: CBS domain-containing protein [Bacteroidetes bacterium]|nr:MAG: CBS domain-containing protein [Bacteroidota bacterium]
MLTVQKLLSAKQDRSIWAVRPDQMVIEALELMASQNIGAVMVMDGDAMLGIFTERDYTRKGIIQGRKAKSTPVTEVMTPVVHPVSLDMDIETCMMLMVQHHTRYLPVVEEDKMIGLLSVGDIVNGMILEQDHRIKFLEQYIAGA